MHKLAYFDDIRMIYLLYNIAQFFKKENFIANYLISIISIIINS